MEQVRARSIFIKLFLGLLVLFGALIIAGWVILHAPWLANNEQILLTRNRYFYQLSKILPPGRLLYSIRPIAVAGKNSEVTYVYKLAGRVKGADYKNNLLTISDMWGRE